MPIQRFTRDEFREEIFDYRPGEHVAIFGPTQRAGKTHLGFQLLEYANRPSLETVTFCMKPRDKTVAKFTSQLEFKEIPEWPPKTYWWQTEPKGYTLWPRHTFDPQSDNEWIGKQFRKAMLSEYKQGDSILFLDEIYGIIAELKLQEEVNALLTRGGGMGVGVWFASQKPSGTQQASLPGFLFNSPTHYFLAPDNDERNRARYAEISGGFNPKMIEDITLNQLRRYEFLYIHAAGYMCIVGS